MQAGIHLHSVNGNLWSIVAEVGSVIVWTPELHHKSLYKTLQHCDYIDLCRQLH